VKIDLIKLFIVAFLITCIALCCQLVRAEDKPSIEMLWEEIGRFSQRIAQLEGDQIYRISSAGAFSNDDFIVSFDPKTNIHTIYRTRRKTNK